MNNVPSPVLPSYMFLQLQDHHSDNKALSLGQNTKSNLISVLSHGIKRTTSRSTLYTLPAKQDKRLLSVLTQES